jgi:hypothetical protein
MSNFLAIATVTATLQRILQAAINADNISAIVTTLKPDAASGQVWSVNLYLYQVTPNAAWRNSDLPTRRSGGELVQRPQLALNLHYLLTFYGDEVNLEPQRLLGSVVRTLHAMPVLTRKMISDTIPDPKKQSNFIFLADSDLADQVELVRFTPISLSTEELSKLWSVFFQTTYNLSIAYQGSVVLIESEESTQSALPVRERKIWVEPFNQPTIEKVVSQKGADALIVTGSTLVIIGEQLCGNKIQVWIGGRKATPESVTDTQIRTSLPIGLQAGVQSVQVVHQMSMGTPPKEHRGVESNVAAFVLHPGIKKDANNNYDIKAEKIQKNESDPEKTKVTIKLIPEIGSKQRVVLLLNEFQLTPGKAQSYSSSAEPRTEDTDTVDFIFQEKLSGNFLVRVQVDGAESPLDIDSKTGQYSNPVVEIKP